MAALQLRLPQSSSQHPMTNKILTSHTCLLFASAGQSIAQAFFNLITALFLVRTISRDLCLRRPPHEAEPSPPPPCWVPPCTLGLSKGWSGFWVCCDLGLPSCLQPGSQDSDACMVRMQAAGAAAIACSPLRLGGVILWQWLAVLCDGLRAAQAETLLLRRHEPACCFAAPWEATGRRLEQCLPHP